MLGGTSLRLDHDVDVPIVTSTRNIQLAGCLLNGGRGLVSYRPLLQSPMCVLGLGFLATPAHPPHQRAKERTRVGTVEATWRHIVTQGFREAYRASGHSTRYQPTVDDGPNLHIASTSRRLQATSVPSQSAPRFAFPRLFFLTPFPQLLRLCNATPIYVPTFSRKSLRGLFLSFVAFYHDFIVFLAYDWPPR